MCLKNITVSLGTNPLANINSEPCIVAYTPVIPTLKKQLRLAGATYILKLCLKKKKN